ncbi:FAD/NAD(P)-binding domain-containing protein [Xylariomycetidae sp. FL0641]|nr:FAD/NAD(P)-binding domain-containing protein [Xylariomycetidae sp. FL0641]
MEPGRSPLHIAIVGGSLAGLLCGIALKHAGHTVTIFEKDDDERPSHMAGVCLGQDARELLSRHDSLTQEYPTFPFSHRSIRVQALDSDGSIRVFVNGRRDITSWDSLYFRLRSCFDGYISSYYHTPPTASPSDGIVNFESKKEVRRVERGADSKITLSTFDLSTQTTSDIQADFLIGADGPNSMIRSKFIPHVTRQYVGYIAWRGTVPEDQVSASTRDIFQESVTVHMMKGQHCVMYTIPGPNGTLEPGKRLLNFLWYTNETPEALEAIMTGKEGHHYRNIVPSGCVRPEIWSSRLEHAQGIPLPQAFLEVIMKIRQPFIQRITEFCSPKATFEDGKVLIIGDALSLFRPHTAFSCTQAAFHTSMVEAYIGGKVSLEQYEENVLRYSYLHYKQSAWWGAFYQDCFASSMLVAVHYWFYCGVDQVKSWWNGQPALLRTSTRSVVDSD